MTRARDLANQADLTFDGSTLKIDTVNDRVGIGTTSPLSGLHISDGTNAGSPQNASRKATLMIDAGATASADLQFMVRSGYNSHIFFGDAADSNVGMLWYNHTENTMNFMTNTVTAMTIDPDQNVGIGTTSPNQLLEVSGNGKKSRFTRSGSAGTVVEYYYGGTPVGGIQVQSTGLGMGGAARENDLFIKTNGNVGIGTTDVRGKLQIGSGIGGGNVPSSHELVFGANNSDITFLSDSSGTSVDGTIGAWNTVYNFQNSKIEFDKPSANLGQLLFYTNTGAGITERMRIQHNGNVGIGTTSPVWKFTVEGSADDDWISRIYNTNANGSGTLIRTDATSAADKIALGVYADGGYKMMVRSTGNVGIGETSPENILHIKTSAAGGPQIELDSTSGTANSAFINFDGTSLQLSTQRDMVDGSKRDTAKSWGGINIIGAAAGSYIQLQTSEGNNNAVSTKMEISKEGYVTKPSTPMFSYLGTRDHAITTTGTQTMTSSNVWASSVNHSFNNGNHFNPSNGRFTAPVAGKYYFQFQCMSSNFNSGYLWFYMTINGSAKSYIQMNQQTNRMPVIHHFYCDLAASEYVTCEWTNNYVTAQIHYPQFSGSLVG